MNHGPLIFLGSFLAMACSWFGLILMPQLQIGRQQAVVLPETGQAYPAPRPGSAAQGEQVYRANGCYYCHSQQVRQTATLFNVTLAPLPKTETPEAAAELSKKVLLAVLQARPGIQAATAKSLIKNAPKPLLDKVTKAEADRARGLVEKAGGKVEVAVQPEGADIERGWGRRRTVAADYLYDYPVMLGTQRIGPDLANLGARKPGDAGRTWNLWHLYDPELVTQDSKMPPYRHLFVQRKKGRVPSPDALKLPPSAGVPKDEEVIPKPEAKALVAYLQSLQADASLFEAPTPKLPVEEPPTAAAPQPAPGATNSPAR